MKTILIIGALLFGTAVAAPDWSTILDIGPRTPIRISEVLADNVHAYADEFGEYDDYIELHNASDEPIDVGGLYLSDDANQPTRWELPAGSVIPAGGYLLVWADGQVHQGPLHASFRLSRDGEQVGLYDTAARGYRYLDRVAFGPQRPDVAFGACDDGSARRSGLVPSPGRPNTVRD
jgi:hypothetical protein